MLNLPFIASDFLVRRRDGYLSPRRMAVILRTESEYLNASSECRAILKGSQRSVTPDPGSSLQVGAVLLRYPPHFEDGWLLLPHFRSQMS